MNKPTILPLFLLLLLCAAHINAQTPSCGAPASNVPPAENCSSACIYCDFNGYIGSTAEYTGNGIPIGGFCSQIQNDQWLGFIAGATSATITVISSNCEGGNGVQVALYPSCNEPPIACNGGCADCGNQVTSINATMVVGANYYLLIDGFSGDVCDFTISVSPANALQTIPIGTPLPIAGADTVCRGSVIRYSMEEVSGAAAYTWSSATPGLLFNGVAAPATFNSAQGSSVEITFPNNFSGSAQICAYASNTCDQTATVCKTVYARPRILTELPSVNIGTSQLPYTLPWGDLAESAGTYEISLTSYQGCDSTVRLQVFVCQKTITLPSMSFCAGSCITVCGQEYCKTGTYTAQCGLSSGTCDSLVVFSLIVADPPTVLPGTKLSLTCKDTVLMLNALSTGDIVWYNGKNQLLANTHALKVSKTGTYTAQSILPNGTVCGSQTVQVKQNIQKPHLIAKGGTLTSSTPEVILIAYSITAGVNFYWTGPDGFTSKSKFPVVSVPGFYTVTVTASNGCSSTTTVEVIEN